MSAWKEEDRVRVVTRPVTEEDRKKNRYFAHLAGLVGTVQQVYGDDEVTVKVERESMSGVTRDVVETATQRMRDKLQIPDEQRKMLTKEELEFDINYVILVRSVDLEAA
jgi:hypothetical protein